MFLAVLFVTVKPETTQISFNWWIIKPTVVQYIHTIECYPEFERNKPWYGGFPTGSDGKESACNVGDLDSIPRLGRSPGGHGHLFQYSRLENPYGQSLVGYSPWGCKELDMTEQRGPAQTMIYAVTWMNLCFSPLNILCGKKKKLWCKRLHTMWSYIYDILEKF